MSKKQIQELDKRVAKIESWLGTFRASGTGTIIFPTDKADIVLGALNEVVDEYAHKHKAVKRVSCLLDFLKGR